MQLTQTKQDPGKLRRWRSSAKSRIARLKADKSGTALIEFALILPIMTVLGMYGTELAYMASVNMQVSQMASSVADNASRLGQTDNSSVTPTVTETDIDSVMDGALEQGTAIDFRQNGRIVLTSLEEDSSTGDQYIHWQRCVGDLSEVSDYGQEGDTVSGGMGSAGHKITAPSGSAVMYAEVFYDYKGLFGDMFVGTVRFKQEAALIVRDDRNLTPGVTGTGGTSTCT